MARMPAELRQRHTAALLSRLLAWSAPPPPPPEVAAPPGVAAPPEAAPSPGVAVSPGTTHARSNPPAPPGRAALARALGLSKPTVGQIVADLVSQGVLVEGQDPPDSETPSAATIAGTTSSGGGGERAPSGGAGLTSGGGGGGVTSGGGGRPVTPVGLSPAPGRLVLVQVGVRTTRMLGAALAPGAAPKGDAWPVCFDTPRTLETFQKRLAKAADRLTLDRPMGVVVSLPGVVDEPAGCCVLCPNLPWLARAGTGLVPAIRTALARGEAGASLGQAGVTLVQEIRGLALGQRYAGGLAGPGVGTGDGGWRTGGGRTGAADDFLLIDVGEGLGGAAVVGGRLYAGALPMSMELGHNRVSGNGRACGCGGVGCLETLLSRGGLVRTWTEAGHGSADAGWDDLVAAMHEGGSEGKPGGSQTPAWIEPTLAAAAAVIGGVVNVLGVDRVVLTGALSELPDAVHRALAQRVPGQTMWGGGKKAGGGEVAVYFQPRRRALGMLAVGIDRLIAPGKHEAVHEEPSNHTPPNPRAREDPPDERTKHQAMGTALAPAAARVGHHRGPP